MTTKKLWLISLLFLLGLVACAPDPRKEAAAQATIIQAQQDALNAEQVRQIKQQEAEAAKFQADYNAAVKTSALETVKVVAKIFVSLVGVTLSLAVCLVLAFGAWTTKNTVDGIGKAAVQLAMVRASLVHMDKATRTFPAFTVCTVDGTQFLTMPATGQTFRLDVPLQANPVLIAALAQVATVGAAYQEMKSANDPAGMAVFQPQVINLEGVDRE